VFVTGLSLPSTVKGYVKDGTIPRFVLWSPKDLGYLTIHAAKALADQQLDPGTRDFGRLKEIRITSDEVILGPPFVFDAGNIDQFSF
jgi:ABC-type sugar transport system substrate-binding protein